MAAVTLASFLVPGFAARALAADDATADTGSVSEIFVTSLKREARLQDAPASITSISDDTLRAASLDPANDLARAVPSLTLQRRSAARCAGGSR